jgi:hypothetical protein
MGRTRFGPGKYRERLWDAERLRAKYARRSDGSFCICNLCDNPVYKTDLWDESHDPAGAKAFGGKKVGIAHHLCNVRHGAQVVAPAVAKSNRIRRRHIGATGPGLGKNPMQGGRRSKLTKTIHNGVQPRKTLAEKLAETRARRTIPGSGPGSPPPD